jgi:hypothetical protein
MVRQVDRTADATNKRLVDPSVFLAPVPETRRKRVQSGAPVNTPSSPRHLPATWYTGLLLRPPSDSPPRPNQSSTHRRRQLERLQSPKPGGRRSTTAQYRNRDPSIRLAVSAPWPQVSRLLTPKPTTPCASTAWIPGSAPDASPVTAVSSRPDIGGRDWVPDAGACVCWLGRLEMFRRVPEFRAGLRTAGFGHP